MGRAFTEHYPTLGLLNDGPLAHVHRLSLVPKNESALNICSLADESSSPQEKEIVEYPYSCYVLGRSGTGYGSYTAFVVFAI